MDIRMPVVGNRVKMGKNGYPTIRKIKQPLTTTAPAAELDRAGAQNLNHLVRPALRLAVPSMLFQFGEQSRVKGAGVAGGDVLAHMLGAAHAHDRRADRG